MKKTKKAVLAAIACSAVLAGAAFGFAGCNNENGETTPAHTHSDSWNTWTVTEKPTKTKYGKATRTCTNDGCTATQADKERQLPMLGSSEYVAGKDTATCTTAGTQHYTYNQNGVSVEFDVDTAINPTAHKYVDYEETEGGHYQVCEYNHAHTTEVEVHDANGTGGTCSKCGYDPNHTHTFDETTWQNDETGHWHAATCGHNVKGSFAAHTYNWEVTTPATADTEGVETGTCTVEGCGYQTTRSIAKLPTAVTGGEIEDDATALTAGRYSVVLTSEETEWWGTIVSQPYFKITATEAKTYTIAVETEGAYADRFGYGENSYTTVLEEGDTFVFYITADEVTNTESGDTVIFTITESDPPVAGTAARPIKVTNVGHFGKAEVEEGEKVFFVIDWEALGGKTLGVTLTGKHVELHRVKADYLTSGSDDDLFTENNKPVVYLNGDKFKMPDYSYVYLYATCSGGDCFVDFTFEHLEGEKELPFTGKTGEETNEVKGQEDRWFKFEGLTEGQYILKSTLANDSFAVYTNVDGGAITSGDGIVVFNVAADTTYYVKANGSHGSESTFTVDTVTEADKGTTAALPYELTAKGDINLISGNGYYKFTATADEKVALNYVATGDQTVNFIIFNNENYSYRVVSQRDGYIGSGSNSYIFDVKNGTTYYIQVSNENGATGTFNFNHGAPTSHNYVITVSDGTAAKFAGVTVKLFNENDNVATATPVATDITNEDGVVTLANVDSSKAYQVVLDGLPINETQYGYYLSDLKIASNIDDTTNFTAKVGSLDQKYTFTLKGLNEDLVEGVKVTLVGGDAGIVLSGTSNAQGVVQILALDPKGGSYMVKVEVPEGGEYIYAPGTDRDGHVIQLTANEHSRTQTITLSKAMTYNLTLTDSEGTVLPTGTVVTINRVSGTVGAEGKVSIATVAGEFDIEIVGYETAVKTSVDEGNIIVDDCEKVNPPVSGGMSQANAATLLLGKTTFNGRSESTTYGKFVATEAGLYTITFSPLSAMAYAGIDNSYVGSDQIADSMSGSINDLFVKDKKLSNGFFVSLTVDLYEGDEWYIGVYGSGKLTVVQGGAAAAEPITLNGNGIGQGTATAEGTPVDTSTLVVGTTYAVNFIMGGDSAYLSDGTQMVTEFTYAEGMQLKVCAMSGTTDVYIAIQEKTA